MNNLIAVNLKKLKKLNGMTNKELAAKAGVPLNTLSKIICGVTTNPTVNTLSALADAMDCEIWEFFDDETGRGAHLSKQESTLLNQYRALTTAGRQLARIQMDALADYDHEMKDIIEFTPRVELPLYLMPTSAGTGEFLDSDDYEMTEFNEGDVPSGAEFALRISGDSMEPEYHNDGIVFVRSSTSIEPGNVGIFTLNGEGYIKALAKDADGKYYLRSFNSNYSPIAITPEDDLRVVGVVL